MKVKIILLGLCIITYSACKKAASPPVLPVSTFSFTIDGVSHSFAVQPIKLQVIDSGYYKGKYLTINTSTNNLPQVQFTLSDRTFAYASDNFCFPQGTYPSITQNSICYDSIPSPFCAGFYMQYIDTGVEKLTTSYVPDSLTGSMSLSLATCSGTPDTIKATFNCLLQSSSGYGGVHTVSSGTLNYITYSLQ